MLSFCTSGSRVRVRTHVIVIVSLALDSKKVGVTCFVKSGLHLFAKRWELFKVTPM